MSIARAVGRGCGEGEGVRGSVREGGKKAGLLCKLTFC